MHPPGESIIAFKASITKEDEAFTGTVNQYDEVSIWATERCIPLVREITFQVYSAPPFSNVEIFMYYFSVPNSQSDGSGL